MLELDRNLYTVAWIAPLYIEAKAALLMLDQKHHGQFSVSRGDDYVFYAGSMCGHNVVIATLPAGQEYGTGSAAALASQVRKSFPNLWFGLLVGVAAGLPNLSRHPPRDIRLGDILVATPDGDTAGLVAYDLGKDIGEDGFQPLRLGHVLAQTETIVRSAIGKIRLNAPNEPKLFLPYYQQIREEEHDDGNFMDPGQDQDILHVVGQRGAECRVKRKLRPDRRRTKVWYGPIGSGEKLMRNSRQRNELRDKYNIIGLEMEAAGTMNRIPVGVIRGVCDYADRHKNKKWQPYAAAMAAAYAKAVLQEILPDKKDELFVSHFNGSSNQSANQSGRGVDSIQQDHFISRYFSSVPSRSAKRRLIDDERGSEIEDSLDISSDTRRARCSDSLPSKSSSKSGYFETSKKEWPEYQTERPWLSAKYMDRCDTPPELLPESDIWDAGNSRIPYIVLVYGLSGVGKSQTCLKAISEQQHRFQSIFYVDASDKTAADSNYVEISRVCNVQHHWEEITVDEQIRITRAWLACRNEPWLLMIDNADDASLPLDRYVPSGGSGTVLITSNNAKWVASCHTSCKISSMVDDEALGLFLKYKDPEADLDIHEIQTARVIAVEELGGLPLAIAQAGSYVLSNRCTYSEYLEEFQEVPQELLDEYLPSLTQKQNRQTIWSTLTMSIRRIQESSERGSAEAIELLKIMSFLHNDGIHERMFQEAWKNMQESPLVSRPLKLFLDPSTPRWDTSVIRAAVGILCRYSLLNPASFSKRQYSLHKVVQIVCRKILCADESTRYAFQAISLVATALVSIKNPLSWIEDPAGLELQKLLLPHVTSSVNIMRIQRLLDDLRLEDAEMVLEITSLFAKAFAATGHYEEAKSLIVESRLKTSQFCVNMRIELRLMEQEAACSAQLGDHWNARQLRGTIYARQESQDLADSQDQCAAMMNLADSTWAMGAREDTLILCQRCLDLREKTLSPQDPRLLRTRRKVAEYLHGMNHKRRALELRESVFRAAELNDHSADIELLDFLVTKTALADSYQWDGRFRQALQLRKDVYEGRNNILGPDHPETLLAHHRLLITQSTLANEGEEQQRLCQLWEKSIIIWKRTLGEFHPHTLEAKVNLGLTYTKLQEFRKAMHEQEAVLRYLHREYYKPSESRMVFLLPYLSSMGRVASLFSKTGQLSTAHEIRRKSAQLAELQYGLLDPVTFTAFNKLLNCEVALGHITLKKLIQKRQKLISDQISFLHPEKTQSSPMIAMHPSIIETMSFLAIDFETAKYDTRAMKLRKELLAAQRLSLGPENRETIGNMRKLALILTAKFSRNRVQVQEGIGLLEEVLAVQEKLLGSDSFQAQDTRKELSRIRCTSYIETVQIRWDLPGSSSDLTRIASSSDRVSQNERNSEYNETSDSSLDTDFYSNRPLGYLSSLLKRREPKSKPIHYSDSSSENFTGESGSETSDG